MCDRPVATFAEIEAIEARLDRMERILAVGFASPDVTDPEIVGVWRLILELRAEQGIPADWEPTER